MKEHFRVVAIDETHCWDAGLLARYHIGVAFGLYAIREGEATHCCSVTPSSWAIALSNEFVFDFDIDPALRAAVIDENLHLAGDPVFGDDVLDRIRSAPGDAGLDREGLDDCYLNFYRDGSCNPRRVSERVTFKVNARDFKGGTKSDAYNDAVWEEAREYFAGNAVEPPILDPVVYLAYEADRAAKRRAENEAPLEGREQLPLFLAAAKRMPYREIIGMRGWIPPYLASYLAERPERMAEADANRGVTA